MKASDRPHGMVANERTVIQLLNRTEDACFPAAPGAVVATQLSVRARRAIVSAALA